MKTSNLFLQECNLWLSDISVYRCRINKIYNELRHLKTKWNHEQAHQKYFSIMKDVHIALNKLNNTETRLLFKIKENSSLAFDESVPENHLNVSTEEELFDQMKSCYKAYIHLQRSMHNLLKESAESTKPLSKIRRLGIRRDAKAS